MEAEKSASAARKRRANRATIRFLIPAPGIILTLIPPLHDMMNVYTKKAKLPPKLKDIDFSMLFRL
jgi:hypothetical protein